MGLEDEVRARDRTHFLAALFAPESVRPFLLALSAYRLELDRIVATVADPLAAEVRLQWWRDALRGEGFGEAGGGVPLVAALRAGMERFAWPADTLCAVSEARIHDLYADPFEDWDAFDGYAGETAGAHVQLAAMALAVDDRGDLREGVAVARGAATAAGHAGVAMTAARASLAFVPDMRKGRTLMPATAWREATGCELEAALSTGTLPEGTAPCVRALAEHGLRADAEMRALMGGVPAATRTAFLPAFVARDTLRVALAKPLQPRPPASWRTQWGLWRAARELRAA